MLIFGFILEISGRGIVWLGRLEIFRGFYVRLGLRIIVLVCIFIVWRGF